MTIDEMCEYLLDGYHKDDEEWLWREDLAIASKLRELADERARLIDLKNEFMHKHDNLVVDLHQGADERARLVEVLKVARRGHCQYELDEVVDACADIEPEEK